MADASSLHCPNCGAGVGHDGGPRRRAGAAGPARCGKMMNRVNFAMLSGAVVDACKGTVRSWTPASRTKIVGFIRDGGRDCARRFLDNLRNE